MSKKPTPEALAEERDDVMRLLIATPPKAHKDEPKRRGSPTPIGKLIANAHKDAKKRDKA